MKNTLNRFIELADKITANPDEQQKYTGFCGLMDKIKTTIPNAITANAKAIDSDTKLRLNICRHYICHNGFGDKTYRLQMEFIKEHYSDIQAWEQETGDTLKERQNKLEQYKDIDFLPETLISTQTYRPENCINSVTKTQKEPHPDQTYCRSGKNYYRQWHNLKNAQYFRLFLQIWQQGNTGDFETICEMVCLYIALKNEADFVADELRLIGQLPQQANEPTTARLITDIEQLPQQQQQAIREGIKSQIEAQILVQKAANPDGLNDYLKAELANATAAMQTLIQESQKDGAIMPTISKNFVWNMERAKKLRQYLPPTSTQPTEATPTATATTPANPLLDNPEFQKILNKTIKAGFVEVTNGGYNWLLTLNELAYFATELAKRGITQSRWKPIETFFNVKHLAQETYKERNVKHQSQIDQLFK